MTIRIGTSEEGGTFNLQGKALGEILQSSFDVKVLPVEGSSVANAKRLHAGELELGFSASNWVGRAMRGEEPFDEPIDIRMVAPANVGPMFFIVRADSDLTEFDDMRGKRVSVNIRESGMYQHVRTIFSILGISFDDFEPVHLNFEEGGLALERGEIDAQWQCPIPNPVMTDIADRFDVRVLEYGGGQLEKVIKGAGFYRTATMKKGAFRGLKTDTQQVGVLNVITTHARVAEALVRELVSNMLQGAELLSEALPLYHGLNLLFEEIKINGSSTFEPDGVPLHPGARSAYQSAGLLK
ncbi:MAG: TAXI family TRAP transporter solute-binding subunit [Rhodospirillaceae bacterium]